MASEEKSTITKLKESSFFVQWLVVIVVMICINLILTLTFGKVIPSFFCADLSNNNWITPNTILMVFTLLSFIIIFATRQISSDKDLAGLTEEEKKESYKDAIPYLIITLSAYTYASSFIRRKFQGQNPGGISGGGIISRAVDSVESINYGTLTLYIGILVFIVNIMSYIFLYLRNKSVNRKNKYARSIYYSQIATLFIGILTSFFVAGFGCSTLKNGRFKEIIIAILKWAILIGGSIFGVHLINKGTEDEDWFEESK